MASYSIPKETEQIFHRGILGNPLVRQYIPDECIDFCNNVSFDGSDKPSVPINWRFAESISALKAYEAIIIQQLVLIKYGKQPGKVKIDTDQAQLFFGSPMLWTYDPDGNAAGPALPPNPEAVAALQAAFPRLDPHQSVTNKYNASATNIYKCKDGRFFHLHGSLDARPTQEALGLPLHVDAEDWATAQAPYIDACAKLTATEVEEACVTERKQAGVICLSVDEYRDSEHGKANEHVGLFELEDRPSATQKPCWWPSSTLTSHARPLAGLKVVELTRIIAAPTIGRGLAELGASVMRITAEHLPDFGLLHPDLNKGKWCAYLNFHDAGDRQKLIDLIMDADVVIEGYRPGSLDKYGFGREHVLRMCEKRDRGIVYVRENCYGWHGPWKDRIGWQQISDAVCGVSYGFGRAMGLEEPVTPVFPNSDCCTGVVGTIAIMTALIRRAEKGGSFLVDTALNYYSRWLTDSVGIYPKEVFEDVFNRNERPVIRHTASMGISLPIFVGNLVKHASNTVWKPEHFKDDYVKHLGKKVRTVGPVHKWSDDAVMPGYQVGARTNGIDKPHWPADLSVEVVA